MPAEMDRLTSQLYYLPTIIGRLGINIAEAQQALNADYVRTIANLLILMKHATGDLNEETVNVILREMAPSRYQFTESTIEFHADLAETLDKASAIGAGFGMGGFMLNASFSSAFGYDYRAAATVTSVLHAVPPGKEFGEALLKRAATVTDSGVTLPDRTAVEEMVWSELSKLRQVMGGKEKALPDPPENK